MTTSINDLIGKEVTVEARIVEADRTWTMKKMRLCWDSLKKPPHRLEAYDDKGNVVFIML